MNKTITINFSERINQLPPYLFAAIDKMKAEAINKGIDLIDLSIGDPDIPTPANIVAVMQKAVNDPRHHQYPSYQGMLSFRQAVATWYQRRFNVALDPGSEVVTLIGSKEGIAHIPLAFVNPGDVVLVPSPGYPVYPVCTAFAGGEVYEMPLLEQNRYLPDLKSIPESILKRAKLMFLNYPNNPTAALATEAFFKEVVDFAYQRQIIVCHDAAYTEMYFDNQKPLSFLQIDGAKEVGLEFHSLSKTYNMTGWRIGFASGNRKIIEGLGKVKTNIDSGAFQAIQEAGIEALSMSDNDLAWIRNTYQERRDAFYQGLVEIGLNAHKPQAAFYIWTKIPNNYNSIGFVAKMLEVGVLGAPGNGFGAQGEGYARFALTKNVDRLKEAVQRLKRVIG